MDKTKLSLGIVFLLLVSTTFFAWKYSTSQKELEANKAEIRTQSKNEPVLDFAKIFVSNVLGSKQDVDFETRLKIENMVRDTKDQEILDQWNIFLKSSSEQEAQTETKKLLEMLINKV
jgi:flagellar basal body-associated protein FliL